MTSVRNFFVDEDDLELESWLFAKDGVGVEEQKTTKYHIRYAYLYGSTVMSEAEELTIWSWWVELMTAFVW